MIKNKKTLILSTLTLLVLAFFYGFSPRRIEFIGYYEKVFVHRANSLEKQKQALKHFDGLELDLVYLEDKNVLDVNHPPAKSIGLTFETYLSQIEPNEFPFLWLDIKGLNTLNKDKILLKLNTLFESKKYPKNKVLIETLFPEALPKFTAAGYKTSYYLKYNLHNILDNELIKEIDYIKSILELQPEIGISSNYKNYTLMKKYFPSKIKYIWALSSPYNVKFFEFRKILEDKNVAVVLSNFKSTAGNR